MAHLPHLLVFRPLYAAGVFSRGVEAEIQHWLELLLDRPGSRRIAFVHSADDIQEAHAKAAESVARISSFRQFFEDDLRVEASAKNLALSPQNIAEIFARDHRPNDLLARPDITRAELSGLRSGALDIAAQRLSFTLLTNIEHEREEIGVYVTSDDESLDFKFVSGVADFLWGRSSAPSFREQIDSALPAGLGGWIATLLHRLTGGPPAHSG